MIYTIEVTSDDLECGIPRESCQCPIALAVKRTMKLQWVSVSGREIMFENGSVFILPRKIINRISKIDDYQGVYGKMRPFKFEIDEDQLKP